MILAPTDRIVFSEDRVSHLQPVPSGPEGEPEGAGAPELGSLLRRSSRGDQAAFARLYDATFGRHPDVGGLDFWTGNIESGTLSLAGVARGFEGSAEFRAGYAGLNNAGFVTRLYENALHRAPDAGGLANWTASLDAHLLSRSEVLLAFSESAEHQMLTANLTGATSGHGIAFA